MLIELLNYYIHSYHTHYASIPKLQVFGALFASIPELQKRTLLSGSHHSKYLKTLAHFSIPDEKNSSSGSVLFGLLWFRTGLDQKPNLLIILNHRPDHTHVLGMVRFGISLGSRFRRVLHAPNDDWLGDMWKAQHLNFANQFTE
ncbi:hypothetical protein Hanom_Chr14g01259031 [Helianthus anomalus]